MDTTQQRVAVHKQDWDDRVLVFQYGRVVAAFGILSQRYAVLIDTLVSPEAAAEMLDTLQRVIGDRQLLVVNTHADWDHCWGNAVFAGANAVAAAPIIAHRLCRERLLSEDARLTLAEKQREAPELYGTVRLQPPTIVFDDVLTIEGGDLTIDLFATPGHTPDHISAYVREIATLFPGDAAELPLPFVDSAATLPQLRASLERLRRLDAQHVLPCHAPGVSSPDVIAANIAYFDTIEQRCRAVLDAGHMMSTDDSEALVGYPLEAVPGAQTLDAGELAFYRDAHRQALKAMIEHCAAMR